METKSTLGMDHVGMFASTACAIHCVLMILIPSGLALGGFKALFSHEAEWAIAFFSVGLGLIAVAIGYRLHRSNKVLAIMLASAAGLFVSRFLEEWHLVALGTALGIVCGVGLAVGHFLNLRATRCCKGCI